MPKYLHIDIETYSPEDLPSVGLYKYSESADFRVLLIAYAMDDDPVQLFDLASGDIVPDWFREALADPSIIKVAHNASFERVCLTRFAVPGDLRGAAFLDPRQWLCTMAQCARCGLPLSLAEAGKALKLTEQKMTEGKNLINMFCKPRKDPSGLFGRDGRLHPQDAPEDWATFCDYCKRDVEVERNIFKALSWMDVTGKEQRLYAIDQCINDRGVLVDMDLVNEALKMNAAITAQLQEEAMHITGLSNPNSVTQLKGWLSERLEQPIDRLTKTEVADLLKETDDPEVRRVLQIRSEMGKTSCAKYESMKKVANRDDRCRGLFLFHGARTGRWAGRLIQMQNLPQNHIKDLADARADLKRGDFELLDLVYGNVPDVLSQLIRTAFVAPKKGLLAVCDYNAIEARVLAWLAGEQWVLDVFRTGGDIYCETASQMFHVPVEKHGRNADLRQKGKIAVLALGYGGGVGALDAMGGQRLGMTEEEEKETVLRWRTANTNIVRLWGEVEDAARACLLTLEDQVTHGLLFTMHDDVLRTLTITLPSGRAISYPRVTIGAGPRGKPELQYWGLDQKKGQFGDIFTNGGKLTENIVQAIARDCLGHAMRLVTDAGLPIVFHVHDELICEVTSEKDLQIMERCFSDVPDWGYPERADGLPLKGAGYVTPYYMKD